MAIKFLSGLNLSNVTAGSILKLDSNGNIVAAVDGTDYNTGSADSWSAVSSDIYRNSDVRIGTYQSGVAPSARLHVFDYQTTDPKLLIEDGNTGDASMEFKISTQSYVMGIDNSDSDKFVLAASTALGTTNVLEISTTGAPAFQGDLLVNGKYYLSNLWNISAEGSSYAKFSNWVRLSNTGFYTTEDLYMDLDDSSSRFVIRSENNTEEFVVDTASDSISIPNFKLVKSGVTTVHTNPSVHENKNWYSLTDSHNIVEVTEDREVYIEKELSSNGYSSFAVNPEKIGKNFDLSFRLSGGVPSSGYRHLAIAIANDGSNTNTNFDSIVFRHNTSNNNLNQIRIDVAASTQQSLVNSSVPNFFDGTERKVFIQVRDNKYVIEVDGVVEHSFTASARTNDSGFVGFSIYESAGSTTWVRVRDFNITQYSDDRTILDGNVGIGTTSPNEKLQIAGNVNAYAPSGIDAGLFASTSAGSTTIALRSNGVTHFNGGNVGIGTTTPDSRVHIEASTDGTGSGADAVLHVKQNGGWNANQPWALYVEGYSYLNGFRINAADGIRALHKVDSGGQLGFSVADTAPITFTQSNSTERMRVHTNGYIGIGTTSPDRQLQIHESTSGTSTAKFTNSTTGEDGDTGFFVGINGSEQPILYGYNNTDMVIGTNGSERMRITSAGNVGIGTTSPEVGFHYHGAVDGEHLMLISNTKTYGTGTGINETAALGFAIKESSTTSLARLFGKIIASTNAETDSSAGTLTFQIRNSGSLSTAMTIKNTGNVGIGIASPSEKLHVSGGNILVDAQYGISFVDANTRIYTNSDSPEDLIVEADQNLHLNPDGSILAQSNISMEGGSIITTDTNNALVLRSDVQHDQGSTDAVISFKQSTTEHAKIDQDGYMYATGFKTTTASTGFLKADGSVDTTTYANGSDYLALSGGTMTGDLTIPSKIIHSGDTDTYLIFGTNTVTLTAGGYSGIAVESGIVKSQQDFVVTGGETFALGERAEGDDNGRTVLIEGAANAASGEGSGRIFFTEHNSTTSSADAYGLSLYYEGDPNALLPSGFQPNTGNATWSLRRHNGSVNGDAIMSGGRTTNNVTFSGTVTVAGRMYVSTVDANTTSTTALVLGTSNEIEKRTLGSNAFSSTSFAPLASPALTGTPTAPTAAAATNTTQVATTAFVTTAVSNLVDSSPAALNTLNELAAALGDDASFSTTMSTALGNRLRIDVNNQSLSSTELANARTNLGLGTAATSAATDFVAVSGDTMTGNLEIKRGHGDLTFLTLKQEDTSGDLVAQKSFIDFTFVDSNTNETPQVRIGAEVGNNDGSASSLSEEGMGAFVVYTNNADTDAGAAGTSLAERFRVDRQGHVGIGTTSPNTPLTIETNTTDVLGALKIKNSGTGDASMFFTVNASGIVWQLGIDNSDGDKFKIGQDNSNADVGVGTKLTIDTSGNVGIGSTAPAAKLNVASTGANAYSATITKGTNMKGIINALSNNADDMVGIYFGTGTTSEGTHWSGITGSRSQSATDWSTQLNFYTHNEDVANINDATQKMVIKGNGNVGIGTTSPTRKLHVSSGATYPAVFDSTQDYTLGLARSGTEEWWLKTYTDGRFAIHENGVGDKLTIAAGGNATFAGTVTHGGLELTSGFGVDQIKEFPMTFQLTANTWTDTGIDGTDLSTGTYAMQVYVSDFSVGGNHYYEYYSATISWYGAATNSTVVDEIPVHRAGHAPNSGDVQFRTQRASGTDAHDLMLQVKHNQTYTGALDNVNGGKIMRFKFRRLM